MCAFCLIGTHGKKTGCGEGAIASFGLGKPLWGSVFWVLIMCLPGLTHGMVLRMPRAFLPGSELIWCCFVSPAALSLMGFQGPSPCYFANSIYCTIKASCCEYSLHHLHVNKTLCLFSHSSWCVTPSGLPCNKKPEHHPDFPAASLTVCVWPKRVLL